MTRSGKHSCVTALLLLHQLGLREHVVLVLDADGVGLERGDQLVRLPGREDQRQRRLPCCQRRALRHLHAVRVGHLRRRPMRRAVPHWLGAQRRDKQLRVHVGVLQPIFGLDAVHRVRRRLDVDGHAHHLLHMLRDWDVELRNELLRLSRWEDLRCCSSHLSERPRADLCHRRQLRQWRLLWICLLFDVCPEFVRQSRLLQVQPGVL